jgi:DNA topoisomerase-1
MSAETVADERPSDPVAAAREVGLRYVSDARPGIRRRRVGKAFSYRGPDGSLVRDRAMLDRIRALAVPPAWTDVWICPRPDGHIQATGRDAKGRKQYRYHPRWREVRDAAKYGRTIAFAESLPAIRDRVDRDMSLPGLSRAKVLAAVVRLLETTFIRVGNAEYARDNRSFGLTTLRDRHARIEGSSVRFRFKGKAGKEHQVGVRDRRLARIVRRCQELPGQELFQYLDADGNVIDVTSGDVNDYLREITGQEFTAKDFRTWGGTVLAAQALRAIEEQAEEGRAGSERELKRDIVRAVEEVARSLGNTPTVCRQCYVHPAILDAYLDGATLSAMRAQADATLREADAAGDDDEVTVLRLLRDRLAREDRDRRTAAQRSSAGLPAQRI